MLPSWSDLEGTTGTQTEHERLLAGQRSSIV